MWRGAHPRVGTTPHSVHASAHDLLSDESSSEDSENVGRVTLERGSTEVSMRVRLGSGLIQRKIIGGQWVY